MSSWIDKIAAKQANVQSRIPSSWISTIDTAIANADDSATLLDQIFEKLLTNTELDITSKNATQLIEDIAQDKLTSEAVVTAFSKKAVAVSKLTNAVTEPLYIEAIAKAKQLDAEKPSLTSIPPLYGLPITVKDSFNVTNVQSTLGVVSRLDMEPAKMPSPIIDILQTLGAIVIAKSNIPQAIVTPESHNNIFGRTLNPANPKEWGSGGSSGGEGVLISQRASPLGLGTDLAGSIRVPAWSNGAFGFKPSLKILPYLGFEDAGKPPGAPGLFATVGPLGQSIEDLQLLLKSVLETKPWEYPGLEGTLEKVTWGAQSVEPGQQFTIGVLTQSPGVTVSDEVKKAIQESATKLANSGHKVVWLDQAPDIPSVAKLTEEVGLPLISLDTECTTLDAIVRGAEPLTPATATALKGLYTPKTGAHPDTGAELIFAKNVIPYTLTDEAIKLSNEKRVEFTNAWKNVFQKNNIDILICPLIYKFAPAHDEFDLTPFAINWNVVDFPALSVPLNRSKLAYDITTPGPTVYLNGTEKITGSLNSDGDVEFFKGMPYAEPPIGDLRFRRPLPYHGSYDDFNATEYGASCYAALSGGTLAAFDDIVGISKYLPPYMRDIIHDSRDKMTPMSEDCLTINVFRPKNTDKRDQLPVMVWIYGGAFQFGSSSMYDGDPFIKESVDMGLPIILVTFNYRLGALGFLGGQAIKEEGGSTNAGLYDQKLALEWVSKHIGAFGGDSNQVLLFGESAGAQSVYMHMAASYYTKQPLFSAAIMQSGSIIPTGYVDDVFPEGMFWRLAKGTSCSDQQDAHIEGLQEGFEALDCLRNISIDAIMDFQKSFVHEERFGVVEAYLAWSPHADGDILRKPVYQLVREGNIAQIPYITGNQQDEGTLFGLVMNSTSTEETRLLFQILFRRASKAQIEDMQLLYPDNPFVGAPFNTGLRNAITPQFKRLSAFTTDLLFHAGRRLALGYSPVTSVPTYVYHATTLHNLVPVLGTFHASDLIWQWRVNMESSSDVYRRYFISFANYYDPNIGSGMPRWPRYSWIGQETLGIGPNYRLMSAVYETKDTYRSEQIGYLMRNYGSILI